MSRWISRLVGTVVLGSALWASGCYKAAAKDTPVNDDRHLPMYVDKLEAPETAAAGEPVTVTVVGSWPTPAWKTEKVLLKRDAKAKILRIVVRGVNEGGGFSIEMIQDHRETVKLPALEAGRWRLVAEGHADTKAEATLTVR